jgi:hypothetical protein
MRGLSKFKLANLVAAAAASAIAALSAGVASAQQYPAPAGPLVSPAPPPSLAPPPVLAYPPPAAGAPVLVAPPAPSPSAPGFASGLQVIAYPYFWLAGLNMAIETPLARAPQVNISAGAGEILSSISTMPFMGAAELRYGPFGVLTDGIHVPVVVPITTRNLFFSGGSTAVVLNVATGDALYRVLDQPWQTVDAGLGFRHWGASTVTTLFARPLLQALSLVQTQQTMTSGGWTDPLIAARYHRDLGNGFGLTAYGDVGGFGIAAHSDWEVIGTLDYAWSPALTFDVGYRSLNVAYSLSRRPIGFDLHLKGPLLGLTLRF